MQRIGRYETQEYRIPIAGRILRLLGPKLPHAIRTESRVEEKFKEDGYMPYWATPWQGALLLAEYLVQNVEPQTQPILELGAGLGLTGLALCMAGHGVVLADYDEDALEFIKASARLNGIEPRGIRVLDWRNARETPFATIIGGDVIYVKDNHAPIARLLSACLLPDGLAYFGDLNRDGAKGFAQAVKAVGFRVETKPVSCKAIPRPDAVDGRTFRGTIYCLRPAHTF